MRRLILALLLFGTFAPPLSAVFIFLAVAIKGGGDAPILKNDLYGKALDYPSVAVVVTGGCFLAYLFLTRHTRKQIPKHRDTPSPVMSLAVVVVISFLFCSMAGSIGNCVLDRGIQQSYRVKVIDVKRNRTGHGTHLNLQTTSWRQFDKEDFGVFDKRVAANLNHSIQPGSEITLHIRPGFFGMQWVEAIT